MATKKVWRIAAMVKYDKEEKRLIIPADINYYSLEEYKRGYQEGYEDGYASGITACTPDYSKTPITFECVDAPEGGAIIVCPPTLYRQLNDGPIVPSDYIVEEGYVPSLWPVKKGDTIRFWASSATTQSYLFNLGTSWWAVENNTGKYKIYGNIMSLQYEQDEYQDATELKYAFIESTNGIFSYSSAITDASNLVLPATTLIERCYRNMFAGCENLTTAPALPATTLARNCYANMFFGCTNLTAAPELPATSLADNCYYDMFSGCTSLTTAPALPATTLANSCYSRMFFGCTSLTTAPELPATTLANYCYSHMFKGCTSLATAPALPATTLAQYCYRGMFDGCTSLNYIKCLATDIAATDCTNYWVRDVSPSGTFETPSTTPWETGINGIPEGWTRVDI